VDMGSREALVNFISYVQQRRLLYLLSHNILNINSLETT